MGSRVSAVRQESLRRSAVPFGQAVVAGAAFGGVFYFLERIVE